MPNTISEIKFGTKAIHDGQKTDPTTGASMTHAAIPRSERLKIGLSDSLIWLSVWIDDVRDLIYDLEMALNKI